LQLNLGYPREHLGALYLVGGGISFFTMRIAGRLVDRHGSARLMTVGVLAFAFVVGCIGILQTTVLPVVPLFAVFMVFQSARNVSQQTLTSRVPRADERAGFQSLQSAVQHAGSALGAVTSSALLTEVGGRLEGMPRVAGLAIGVAVVAIPLAFVLEKQVRRPVDVV
jgi:predicted MFS family arabinose efflux permease